MLMAVDTRQYACIKGSAEGIRNYFGSHHMFIKAVSRFTTIFIGACLSLYSPIKASGKWQVSNNATKLEQASKYKNIKQTPRKLPEIYDMHATEVPEQTNGFIVVHTALGLVGLLIVYWVVKRVYYSSYMKCCRSRFEHTTDNDRNQNLEDSEQPEIPDEYVTGAYCIEIPKDEVFPRENKEEKPSYEELKLEKYIESKKRIDLLWSGSEPIHMASAAPKPSIMLFRMDCGNGSLQDGLKCSFTVSSAIVTISLENAYELVGKTRKNSLNVTRQFSKSLEKQFSWSCPGLVLKA